MRCWPSAEVREAVQLWRPFIYHIDQAAGGTARSSLSCFRGQHDGEHFFPIRNAKLRNALLCLACILVRFLTYLIRLCPNISL